MAIIARKKLIQSFLIYTVQLLLLVSFQIEIFTNTAAGRKSGLTTTNTFVAGAEAVFPGWGLIAARAVANVDFAADAVAVAAKASAVKDQSFLDAAAEWTSEELAFGVESGSSQC